MMTPVQRGPSPYRPSSKTDRFLPEPHLGSPRGLDQNSSRPSDTSSASSPCRGQARRSWTRFAEQWRANLPMGARPCPSRRPPTL